MRRLSGAIGIFLMLLTLLSPAGGMGYIAAAPEAAVRDQPAAFMPVSDPDLPPGATGDWLSAIEEDLRRQEYNLTRTEAGADFYQAPNREQGFRTYFTGEGLQIVPRELPPADDLQLAEDWWVTVRPYAWGTRVLTTPAGPTTQENKAFYRYSAGDGGEVRETDLNTAGGVEQRFDFRGSQREGPFQFDLAVGGNLILSAGDSGLVQLHQADGTAVLRYGNWQAYDVEGRELVVWAEVIQSDKGGTLLRFEFPAAPETFILRLSAAPKNLPAVSSWKAELDQEGSELGFSVAAAGDVNGDGYYDLLVGADMYDAGYTNEGAAFVYYGSAAGLGPAASWSASGRQAEARFGRAVARGGDINKDGYADILVSALYYDNGQTDEGVVFAWYGSAAGLGASGTPANADWRAEGNQDNANLSRCARAGDVNGDGYGDVIVGAPLYDNGQTDEGKVWIYLGSAAGLYVTPSWSAESDQADARMGYSVNTAGSVNGDAYADIIVGAYLYDNGQIDEGRVYVWLGSSGGLAGTPWMVESDQANARYGFAVAPAGDINNDSYADVLLGAPYYSETGKTNSGRAVIYQGSVTGLGASPTWTYNGADLELFGFSVSGVADVNDDGYSDILIGAPNYDNDQIDEGRAYLFLGTQSGLDTLPAWTVESDQNGSQFGSTVAGLGDVNKDGFSDIAVGAPFYDNGQADEGTVFAWYGAVDGVFPTPGWSLKGSQTGAELGYSVGAAGDVNGDGYSDVIISSDLYDHGETDEGVAWVFLGTANGLSTASAWSVESNQANARLGRYVGTAGDVNGDGYGDLLLGAQLYDNGQTDEGAVFAWYGSATGLGTGGVITNAVWRAEGDQANANLSRCAGAGDVNGDGYSDVIVGAPLYDNGQTDEGRAWVYLGSATGLRTTAVWSGESDQSGANFGYAVNGAGDVNGDSYGDVIIGASSYDNTQTDSGRVYVWRGTAAGLESSAWATFDNPTGDTSRYGFAVASAGDVNGDGYADIIYSGPYEGAANAGDVRVHYGSPTGFNGVWHYTGLNGDYLGWSMGSAGDVNGDGYADIIVGAPYYDDSHTDEGRVLVFYGSGGGLPVSPTAVMEGNQAGANLGAAAAAAGDVNGDGLTDLMAGATYYNGNALDTGAVFLWYSRARTVAATAGWSTESNQTAAQLGIAASSAGDVNCDGYADVAVGAPFYDNGESDEGAVFVYLGAANGPAASYSWMAESNQASAGLGAAVGNGGDVNGDGCSELLVGAPAYDRSGQSNNGAAWAWYGSPAGLGANGSPTNADWAVYGELSGETLGYRVGEAGDVNGDGLGDVMVGVPGFNSSAGAAYVYYGTGSGLPARAGWTLASGYTGSYFGFSGGAAGDVNGDGYGDLLVGAPQYTNGEAQEGGLFVYAGGPAGLSNTPAWAAESNQAGARLGQSGSAVDINNDGFSDLLVGAPNYSKGEAGEGAVFIWYGGASWSTATGTPANAAWTGEVNQVNAGLGTSVSGVGDVNGDGYGDWMAGAPNYDSGGINDVGAVFGWQGSVSGPAASWQLKGDQAGAGLGTVLAGAGDVNGDGYGDILVGSPGRDNGQTDEGWTGLYYGNGGAGLALRPRQLRADGSAPVALKGGVTGGSLQLQLVGRMPLGREAVRLQWQVAAWGRAFTATGVISGVSAWTDVVTGNVTLTKTVSGLTPGLLYRWRVRLLYKPGNRLGQAAGPWLAIPWNSGSEGDFRILQNPPQFTSAPLTVVEEDLLYHYAVTTVDVDPGNVLTLTAPILPAWLAFTRGSNGGGTLSGTPTNADVGLHPVVLRVSDNTGLTATQAFTISVVNINDAPFFSSLPLRGAVLGQGYVYTVTATDIDAGDGLTVTAPVLPGWLSWTATGNGTGRLTGTPAVLGVYSVTLQVQDGAGTTALQLFTVTVNSTNQAPQIVAIADQQTGSGRRVGPLAVTLDDLDTPGEALTVSVAASDEALFPPAGMVVAGSGLNRTLTLTPTAGMTGTARITVTVGDGQLQAATSFQVEVQLNVVYLPVVMKGSIQ